MYRSAEDFSVTVTQFAHACADGPYRGVLSELRAKLPLHVQGCSQDLTKVLSFSLTRVGLPF